MGSFTFSEILTIVVVILIVFGPKRLPELARRAGELVAKTRDATRSVTQTLEREYGDQAQPFRDLKEQVDGVRDDLRTATSSVLGEEEASSVLGAEEASSVTGVEEAVSVTEIGEVPAEGGNAESTDRSGDHGTDPTPTDRGPDGGDDPPA